MHVDFKPHNITDSLFIYKSHGFNNYMHDFNFFLREDLMCRNILPSEFFELYQTFPNKQQIYYIPHILHKLKTSLEELLLRTYCFLKGSAHSVCFSFSFTPTALTSWSLTLLFSTNFPHSSHPSLDAWGTFLDFITFLVHTSHTFR